MANKILVGDCVESMKTLPDQSVQCCVTSPPYWGLRDYGKPGQLGLEKTPDEYVANMVTVFREVRRVLRDDGLLWLNIGDAYINGNLACTPWLTALGLRADGWNLRQDNIWAKLNPMPESVKTRCTRAHEYVFMLSKTGAYYFDAASIKEPQAEISIRRAFSKNNVAHRKDAGKSEYAISGAAQDKAYAKMRASIAAGEPQLRNKWSVWHAPTGHVKGAHFAAFSTELIEPCILAGSKPGDTILDPFGGAGTTGLVAQRHGRHSILCELNPDYVAITEKRLADDMQKQLSALL